MKFRFYTGAVALSFICFTSSLQASEPLGKPDIDDMVLYDDEMNTVEEIKLGKILFFDKRLSGNYKQSCATCHNPSLGFSDGMAKGLGTRGNQLGRNTPHLYNLGWGSIFMWDGREATLESQALGPIKSSAEMNLPIPELLVRLNAVPSYRRLFKETYQVDVISGLEVGRALAAFERTIVVDNTPYDKYVSGDKSAMSASAILGLAIFQGKGNCIKCHDGANFTDDSFHSLGISDGDDGRGAITGDKSQIGAFKTPGLRNIAYSSPYMHNGALNSLTQVVDYYNRGGDNANHTDSLIKPLNLTSDEQKNLVSFMMALSQPLTFTTPVSL